MKLWKCFCGSFDIVLVTKTIRKRAFWKIEALCKDCGRRLIFTKYGMGNKKEREINKASFEKEEAIIQ